MPGMIDPFDVAQALDRGGSTQRPARRFSIRLRRVRAMTAPLAAALRDAQESLGEGMLVSDAASGDIVYASPGAATLVGRPAEAIAGIQTLDLLATDARPAAAERLRLHGAGHQVPPRFETVIARPDGRRVAVEAATSSLVAGGRTMIVTLLRDVGHRDSQEHRIEVEEALIDAVLDASSSLIVIVDADGGVRRLNPVAERILAVSEEDALGRSVATLGILDEERGSRRVVWTPAAAGPPGWVVWTGEDVTERERIESELTRLKLADIPDDDGRTPTGRLVASLAHDLREPARVTGGFAALLADRYGDTLDQRGMRMIAAIRDAAVQMGDLLDDLSSYGRADRSPRPAPFALEEVMGRVRASLAGDIQSSGAEIVHGQLPTLVADPAGVEQVVGRLVENAIKFRNGQPLRIEVQATRMSDAWQVDVADTGIGIKPRDRERVFELFCRLHPRETYEGTGAGLAICRRIVERHGGEMWVGESPSSGTTLCFTIPDRPTAR